MRSPEPSPPRHSARRPASRTGTPGTSGLERPILVAVPMRLPCIGAFVLGGSCLLESLLEHRLVEEPGDEGLHAVLRIGKITFDER